MPKSKTPIHARQHRPSALVNACDLYARTVFRRDAAQVRLAEARAHEAAMRTALATAEQNTAQVVTELAELEVVLQETGRFIQTFDARLLPQRIRPVRTTKGRYKGGLIGTIVRVLAKAPPEGMKAGALLEAVVDALGLSFANPAAAKVWRENSFRTSVQRLHKRGDIVYLNHDPRLTGGRWRLTGDVLPTSLTTLRSEVDSEFAASEPGSDAPPSRG